MRCSGEIFVGNTNKIEVEEVKSEVTGLFLTDADLEFTIVDSNGDEVAGQVWPSPMAYVLGTDGTYRGIVKDTCELVAGADYTAVIEGDAGPDNVARWEYEFRAQTRRGV